MTADRKGLAMQIWVDEEDCPELLAALRAISDPKRRANHLRQWARVGLMLERRGDVIMAAGVISPTSTSATARGMRPVVAQGVDQLVNWGAGDE